MLDLNQIRENPEGVRQALLKRMEPVGFDDLLGWDQQRRELITEIEKLRELKNKASAQIPQMKKAGLETVEMQNEMKGVSARIKDMDLLIADVEARIRAFIEGLPNPPADDVTPGGKENNKVIRAYGEKRERAEGDKDHVELVTTLGLVDYERGVKLGGSGFWLYRGDGALLEWALLNFFITRHIELGYEFVLPPHILTYSCGYTAGQFPKFKEDVFHLASSDGKDTHFLLPTAETALVNLHRDEILAEEKLPLKYFAYTPCFRKEAGSYRAQERGMIRGHQFNKVELFQFTRPEDSDAALEEMIGHAEGLVRDLGLHHRVSKLAAQDVSASMAKTYDIEVWIPSMGEYKEVSSASNAHGYQARRGNIRFKRRQTGKNELVHTLNASGLATSRILPAIVEQHQRRDGSVLVPEVLRPYMRGKEILKPVTK